MGSYPSAIAQKMCKICWQKLSSQIAFLNISGASVRGQRVNMRVQLINIVDGCWSISKQMLIQQIQTHNKHSAITAAKALRSHWQKDDLSDPSIIALSSQPPTHGGGIPGWQVPVTASGCVGLCDHEWTAGCKGSGEGTGIGTVTTTIIQQSISSHHPIPLHKIPSVWQRRTTTNLVSGAIGRPGSTAGRDEWKGTTWPLNLPQIESPASRQPDSIPHNVFVNKMLHCISAKLPEWGENRGNKIKISPLQI